MTPARLRSWAAAHPRLTLALLVTVLLAPFLAKPFNMDEPLFLWAAKQILAHPANPYGFAVNWYGSPQPMWSVTENPPLACYYLALAAAIGGWSEIGLHLALLLPAIAAILGTHRLARQFCRQPLLAALVTLCTPVFLVSANTVMCDVMLLALWVWAVALWMEGLAREDFRRLLFSGVLMALALWCKYYGLCLVPLLAAYGFAKQRAAGRWLLPLLIPLAALVAYESATLVQYGAALFSGAASYAAVKNRVAGVSPIGAGVLDLAFTGGCAATVVFLLPLVCRRRTVAIFAGIAALMAAALMASGIIGPQGKGRGLADIQLAFWAAGGLAVLALALGEFRQRRDAGTLLLGLWIVGTFVFAGFINWTINGRSILPLIPPVAILLARRLEAREKASAGAGILLVAGAALALLVARADYCFARSVRQSARQTLAQVDRSHQTLWFQGHWGYQYYMELAGATAVDMASPVVRAGDLLAVPWNNTNQRFPKSDFADRVSRFTVSKGNCLTVTDGGLGAGFYDARLERPLPFVFGEVPDDEVLIYRFKAMTTP
jgi:4-amino-4-deoxy-L-arabinose transferase-like glycosyltransferase